MSKFKSKFCKNVFDAIFFIKCIIYLGILNLLLITISFFISKYIFESHHTIYQNNYEYQQILKNFQKNQDKSYLQYNNFSIELNENNFNNQTLNKQFKFKFNDLTNTQSNYHSHQKIFKGYQQKYQQLFQEIQQNQFNLSDLLQISKLQSKILSQQQNKSKSISFKRIENNNNEIQINFIIIEPQIIKDIKCLNNEQYKKTCSKYLNIDYKIKAEYEFDLMEHTICYDIKLLTDICIVLKNKNDQIFFKQGCFKNNQIGKYKSLKEVQKEQVQQLEVRLVDINDPYLFQINNQINEQLYSLQKPLYIQYINYFYIIGLFLISLVLFLFVLFCILKKKQRMLTQNILEGIQLKEQVVQNEVDLDQSLNNAYDQIGWVNLESSFIR